MASALVTLVPSRADNCPLTVIESLAVGTPLVASAAGGIVELVRDGIDGFLITPDDPEALAEKLKILLTNPKLREKMGANARRRFLDCFEQREAIAKQADWLEEIVATREYDHSTG